MDFKIGDIITGKYGYHEQGFPYYVTTSSARMVVTELFDADWADDIRVCVMQHKTICESVGMGYSVSSKWFRRIYNEVL